MPFSSLPSILLQFSGITQQLRSDVFHPMVELCWVLSAVFGAVGALKIYNKWQLNSRMHVEVTADIAAWIGAAVFFLVARLFIKLSFNL
jgi:uncharacterized membrane protein YeaQ/YmgE (transglycosylase-associated protein family)